MKIFTPWQKPALEPTFVMPNHGSASVVARPLTGSITDAVAGAATGVVHIDAVRVTGIFPGSPAWSPPIS